MDGGRSLNIIYQAEGTKKIPLDPNNSDGKVLTISADLDPK